MILAKLPITPDRVHLDTICYVCEGEGLCECEDYAEWDDKDREEVER